MYFFMSQLKLVHEPCHFLFKFQALIKDSHKYNNVYSKFKSWEVLLGYLN